MRVLAPAKINLHLRVDHPRGDGFHPVLTWMCTVGLFDTLILERSQDGRIDLSCDLEGLPADQGNLVNKAAAAMADSLANAEADRNLAEPRSSELPIQIHSGAPQASEMARPTQGQGGARNDFGLSLSLQKRIPVGAGLGGGSSDGARILLALNQLWNVNWSMRRLADFPARLGSDLPFFFFQPSAICRGRGEIVTPISFPAPRFAVLIFPGRAMPTRSVYEKFDEIETAPPASIESEPPWDQWVKLSARQLLPLLVNDLEPAAFAIDPDLGRLRADAEQTVSRPVRMSGSGSTLFSLFDEETEAIAAARNLMQRHGVQALEVDVAPVIRDDLNTHVKFK